MNDNTSNKVPYVVVKTNDNTFLYELDDLNIIGLDCQKPSDEEADIAYSEYKASLEEKQLKKTKNKR